MITRISFAQKASTIPPSGLRGVLLRIEPASTQVLTVPIGRAGTAIIGKDWTAPSAVTIPAGKASYPINLSFTDDFQFPETAILQLKPGSGYQVGTNPEHTIRRMVASTKPGPTNTGPKGMLTPIAGMTVTAAGTVIEGKKVNGGINVKTKKVKISNCLIDAQGGFYGIQCENNEVDELVIEDCEVINHSSVGVYGRRFKLLRSNIHEGGGDAVKAHGGCELGWNWFHHLGMGPGAHADGDQSLKGIGLWVHHNNFDMPINLPGYESNSCMSVSANMDPVGNVLIEYNWMNGGNYTLFLTNDQFGPVFNMRLMYNRFGRDFRYGPLVNDTDAVISGNVWDDTGELMEINTP